MNNAMNFFKIVTKVASGHDIKWQQGFHSLLSSRRVAIVIDNTDDFGRAIQESSLNAGHNFDSVRFWIRDLDTHAVLYGMDVTPDNIIIRDLTPHANKLMLISIPSLHHIMTSASIHTEMGRIKHPSSGFKLFTISRIEGANELHVYKNHDSPNTNTPPFLKASESQNIILQSFQCMGVAFDARCYTVLGSNNRPIARIKPDLRCGDERVYSVSFEPNLAGDQELRAVILGMACLLSVKVAYSQLCSAMEEHKANLIKQNRISEDD